MGYDQRDWNAINTIRMLAVDATFKANSGHPGAPMGMAPVAHVLFTKFMNLNPDVTKDEKTQRWVKKWVNRDRFILSNGHGCMLQYALLHLCDYDVSMDDLKAFRQIDSKCPGHPESHDTPGIEVTTGPLGQGFGNAVGLAIAERHTAATFNKPNFELINNYTYCFLGDGCLMEGIASEAASLAGHLRLGKLICIYDDNHISIDGDTICAFTEDVLMRFEAYGWHTQWVKDGDHDLEGIEAAIKKAQEVTDKPSFIKLTTTIGFGSKLQGTHGVHGNPLKADDIKQVREKFFAESQGEEKEKTQQPFYVDDQTYKIYHDRAEKSRALEKKWNELFSNYSKEHKELADDLNLRLSDKLPQGWEKSLPRYTKDDKPDASRKLSEKVLQDIHDILPSLMSGSADLTGSNNTIWKGAKDFQSPDLKNSKGEQIGDWSGRYMRYGVREHAMAAAMNGMAAYGTVIPAGGTFLNFVSYAAGSVRLSALSHQRVIYIATHDSIGLGEDGPTHQPIETLAHFRALPNIMVWRPADGNETSAAYYMALTSPGTPSIFALTRQNMPQLELSSIEKATLGGYVALQGPKDRTADVTIVSTGSEVGIALEAASYLKEKHDKVARVVSMPCVEVFDLQEDKYRMEVIPDGIPALSFEAMSTLGWEKYSHEQFGLNRFGASGAYKDVYKKFNFTPEGVADKALKTIEFYKDVKPLRSPLNRAFRNQI